MEELKYRVGRFDPAVEVPHAQRSALIDSIAARMYEWHGRHHVAHVTNLCKRMGWD